MESIRFVNPEPATIHSPAKETIALAVEKFVHTRHTISTINTSCFGEIHGETTHQMVYLTWSGLYYIYLNTNITLPPGSSLLSPFGKGR